MATNETLIQPQCEQLIDLDNSTKWVHDKALLINNKGNTETSFNDRATKAPVSSPIVSTLGFFSNCKMIF